MTFIYGNFEADDPNPILKTIREFDFLDMEKGAWIAGGAVRRIFMQEDLKNADLDIFLSNIRDLTVSQITTKTYQSIHFSS